MSQSTQCLGPVVPLAMFHVSSLISHIAQIQLTLEFNQFLLSSSEQSQIFIPFNLRKALAKPSFDLGKFSTKSSPISFDLLQSFSLYLPLRFTSSKNWASLPCALWRSLNQFSLFEKFISYFIQISNYHHGWKEFEGIFVHHKFSLNPKL